MATELGYGFTHVALPVTDLDRSVAFYEAWAGMKLVDRLEDAKTGNQAARLSDGTRPFVLALIQTGQPVAERLGAWVRTGHRLSLGCVDGVDEVHVVPGAGGRFVGW